MKAKRILTVGLLAVAVMIPNVVGASSNYGALGAMADDSITMEEALVYAMQDEQLARASYEAVQEKLGEDRIFSNLERAETNHMRMVANLMTKYGLEVPEDLSANHVVVAETMEENYEAGVKVEEENIVMYEKFLDLDFPADVDALFTRLLRSSESHLRAFENGLKNGGAVNVGIGRGMKQGYGNNDSSSFENRNLGRGRFLNR